MEPKGTKRVKITGVGNKHQIQLCCVAKWMGTSCLLNSFTSGKQQPVSHNTSFLMIGTSPVLKTTGQMRRRYIIPYLQKTIEELGLPPEQAALALLMSSKASRHKMLLFYSTTSLWLPIPANCTDRLQPMYLSENKAANKFMHSRFREWYAMEVQKHLDSGTRHIVTC